MRFSRYSKKREFIYNALKENPVHPTAETLREILKKEKVLVSIATIYRNLNSFAEEGRINKFTGSLGQEHFDHNTHEHSHLQCLHCGKIMDIEAPFSLNQAGAELEKETGFKISAVKLHLSGSCKACSRTVKKMPKEPLKLRPIRMRAKAAK